MHEPAQAVHLNAIPAFDDKLCCPSLMQHCYSTMLCIAPCQSTAARFIPSRKPFLKRRGRFFMYLMRPVPVVLLPMAFTDQPSGKVGFASFPREEGKPDHDMQIFM